MDELNPAIDAMKAAVDVGHDGFPPPERESPGRWVFGGLSRSDGGRRAVAGECLPHEPVPSGSRVGAHPCFGAREDTPHPELVSCKEGRCDGASLRLGNTLETVAAPFAVTTNLSQ